MSGVDVFFDTNVLVYYLSDSDGKKERTARLLISQHMAAHNGAVSAQVMQECVNVLFKSNASLKTVQTVCERLLRPMLCLDTSAELIESAAEIKSRWQYAFYDCLIIAGAIACGAKTLYSEDLQHGQRIENLTIVNPFLPA